MSIRFKKASSSHIDTIFSWLAKSYEMEFWGNTQGQRRYLSIAPERFVGSMMV